MPPVWCAPAAHAVPRHHGPGGRAARTAPPGWGEFSPFLDYDDRECVAVVAGRPRGGRRRAGPTRCRDRDPGQRDGARGRPGAGGRDRARVRRLPHGQGQGRRARPVRADDLARVEAVRDALGPDGHVRVDANGGWDVDTAVTRCRALDRAAGGLEYVEQPCATVEEPGRRPAPRRRADRRRRVDPPGRGPDAGRRRSRRPTSPCSRCSRSAGSAPACGSPSRSGCPSSCPRRSRRRSGSPPGVALAAALPELPYACGLATVAAAHGRRRRRARCSRSTAALPVRRPRPTRPARGGPGRPRDAGALVRQDRRRAGTGPRVNPSTALAPRPRRRAGPLRRARGGARARVPLGAAGVRPARGRRRRAGCGCTCASTSGRPASSPSAWPRPRARPVPVVTTTGTAAANLHPAVLEASESGVPLVVLTADRPPELRGDRRQPDRRPGRAVRPRRAAVPRGRRSRAPARAQNAYVARPGLPGARRRARAR